MAKLYRRRQSPALRRHRRRKHRHQKLSAPIRAKCTTSVAVPAMTGRAKICVVVTIWRVPNTVSKDASAEMVTCGTNMTDAFRATAVAKPNFAVQSSGVTNINMILDNALDHATRRMIMGNGRSNAK
uniref:Uncharacterized protein n=1 Tax=Anopheles arabiensis TaxID=7173 RepID=A0A182I6E5_ANOAR